MVLLCADGCTSHKFPWLISFLADDTEQCIITIMNNGSCPPGIICPHDIPGCACMPRCHYPQWYFHLSTKTAEAVVQWTLAYNPNFTDGHADYTIYRCIHVDRLHQPLKGMFQDHTLEWIVGFPEDICGQEQGLDEIDEQFSKISHFSDIHQFGDELAHVTQWTSAEYMDIVKVWFPAHTPRPNSHPAYFEFTKSVADFILIASYHSHMESTLKHPQDVLNGITISECLDAYFWEVVAISSLPSLPMMMANTVILGQSHCTTLCLSSMHDRKSLTLQWCSLLGCGQECVHFFFYSYAGQYFVFERMLPRSHLFAARVRPNIRDVLLTPIFRRY